MDILFLDAYFYPENIAFSHLEWDILDGLKAAGHRVTVVCPTPSRGLSSDEIKRYKRIKQESYKGIRIKRFWAPRERKNPILRAIRYLWCNLREYAVGKRCRNADVLFAVSTPPTQGRIGGKLSKKLGIPFVYSIQDLFPDSLVSSGLARENSVLFRLGKRMEKKTYRLADKIIVLSDAMRKTITDRGVSEEKLEVVSNWIDTESVIPVEKEDNPLFEEYGLDRNKFNVVYAGNFGASQGADIILRAADMLKDNRDISFVIFGGGTEFEKAKMFSKEKQLENVKMFSLLSPEKTALVYSLGDIALITCKKGVGKTAVPSKLWSIMACNTPIIASFDTDSELSRVLDDSGAGICVEPENAEMLARSILDAEKRCKDLSEKETKVSPRDYLMRHASQKESVGLYVSCIENVKQ